MMHINTIYLAQLLTIIFSYMISLLGIKSSNTQVVCVNANVVYSYKSKLAFPLHTFLLVMPSLKRGPSFCLYSLYFTLILALESLHCAVGNITWVNHNNV